MNSELYYFLIASSVIFIGAGIGLMILKKENASPSGIVETITSHKMSRYTMIALGIVSGGLAMYYAPNSTKLSLRGF